MSASFQLPDLLTLCRPFELRTNNYCRPATVASESWLSDLKSADFNQILTPTELKSLHPAKYGLLAAVCVPRCGQTQLRFFTDFLSLLSIADGRVKHACSITESGWTSADETVPLRHHVLFQYLLSEIEQFTTHPSVQWKIRFANSVNSYRLAQTQSITNRINNVIPDLETSQSLRRGMSGIDIVLDLIELTENLVLYPLDTEREQKLRKLKQLAIDIICLSLDVVSFNNDQVQGNSHNLINVLMTHKGISLQGAVNTAGGLIKEMIDDFLEIETSLLRPSETPRAFPNHPGNISLSSYWNWLSSPFSAAPSTPSSMSNVKPNDDLVRNGDLSSFVQTLRDFIVGTINWVYETELYFGGKGEEIRTFGWVFLNSMTEDDGR